MTMSVEFLLALVGVAFLALANGANDNFKGVATLFGSRTTSYKIALVWGTLTTLVGSLAAFFLAQKLMHTFTGKGLVPDEVLYLSSFSIAVTMASALTVFLATLLGFPVSTTHAITGALVGAGVLASPENVNLGKLGSSLLLPLLFSPVIALFGAAALYPLLSRTRTWFGVTRESCLCIGNRILVRAPKGFPLGAAAGVLQIECCPQISVGTEITCEERYMGQVWGLSAKTLLDTGHFVSAGLVSFARGLNDTPKIAALLLLSGSFTTSHSSLGVVAFMMALGGIFFAKKIATTMSHNITEMNDGQGFSANIVTSLIVLVASHLGLPVSTTHVSCGSIIGIGTTTKQAKWGSISRIAMAWVITLPVAAGLGLLSFALLKRVL
jgi:inorganic phosphate transporter, PiT family